MRSRLLGVIVVALAFGGFGALPAAALGEEVTLRANEEALEEGAPITALSENVKLFAGTIAWACSEVEIGGQVIENPGAQIELNQSRFEGSGTMEAGGTILCSFIGTGGRVEVGMRPLEYESPLTLRENESEEITGSVRATFEFAFWDRSINPDAPAQECKYEATFLVGFSGDILSLEATGNLIAIRNPDFRGIVLQCPKGLSLGGDFRLTSEGNPVTAM